MLIKVKFVAIFLALKTVFGQSNFGYQPGQRAGYYAPNGNFQNNFPFQQFMPNGNYQLPNPYQNRFSLPQNNMNNFYRPQSMNFGRQQPQGSSVNLIGNMARNIGSSNGQNYVNSVINSRNQNNRGQRLPPGVSISSVGNTASNIYSYGGGSNVANSVLFDQPGRQGNIVNSVLGVPQRNSNINLIGNSADNVFSGYSGNTNVSQFFQRLFGRR